MNWNFLIFWIVGVHAVIAIATQEFPVSDVIETLHWSPRSNATNVEWEFFIVGKRVTWSDAKVLCSYGKSAGRLNEDSVDPEDLFDYKNLTNAVTNFDINPNSRLAVLEDDDAKTWLSRMLAESNYRYDGLWIGGHRTNSSSDWTWIGDDSHNEVVIPSSSFFGNYPDWYRTNDRQDMEKNCLIFDRVGHDLPILVPTDCQLSKPFLCSRVVKKKIPKKIVEGRDVTVEGHRYTIFSVDDGQEDTENRENISGVRKLNGGGVRWRDARLECRKRGQYLATILSNEAATAIAGIMLKNRPSMESAWLGGWSTDGTDWTWSPTGFELSSTKSLISQYPPWLTGHPVPSSNFEDYYQKRGRCLILDRHLCPDHINPVFLDLDCEKKRPFICQDGIPQRSAAKNLQIPVARSIRVGKKNLEFSVDQMTWNEGREHCANNHGRIASIRDSETLTAVLDKMTDLFLDHVWVGGRTEKRKNGWRWFDETGKILTRKGIGFGSSWCLGDDEESWPEADPHTCLNLDREGHGLPLFYGLPCDFAKQHVLCEIIHKSRSLDEESTTLEEEKKVETKSARKLEGGKFSFSGSRSFGPTAKIPREPEKDDGSTTGQPELLADKSHEWFNSNEEVANGNIGITELASLLEKRIGDLARANRSGIVFVLDDSFSVLNAWLAEELKLVAVIIRNIFPLSEEHPMGLLTLSKIPKLALALNQTNECSVLSFLNDKILGNRRFNRNPNGSYGAGRGSNDQLVKAAAVAADVAKNSGLQRVAIMFVMDGDHRIESADHGRDHQTVVEKFKILKNSGYDVYALFVGQAFRTFASFTEFQELFGESTDGKRNIYTVQSFAELSELVATINSTASKSNKDFQCDEPRWVVPKDDDHKLSSSAADKLKLF